MHHCRLLSHRHASLALGAALVLSVLAAPSVAVDPPAGSLTGKWLGVVDGAVRVYYEIAPKWDGSCMGSNGIIELNLSGGPVETISLVRDTVRFEELESNQLFVGVLSRDGAAITGQYTNLNTGRSWPLELARVDSLPLPPRPQTPRPPYPYDEEQVVYEHAAAGIHIAGTLTLPRGQGPFPAALLISGSGQQNRDGEIAFHRPFMVLADQLTRGGTAVLRVDDRGVGGTTRRGTYFSATTSDLARDAAAGIAYLKSRKEVDPARIGLIGHSEGGLIATMLAAEDSAGIAWVVLLASPAGGAFAEGIVRQDSVEARARGADDRQVAVIRSWCRRFYDIVLSEPDDDVARQRLQRLVDERTAEEQAAFDQTGLSGGTLSLDYALTPHFRYLLTMNPDEYLEAVRCPVLAIMGDRDTSGSSRAVLAAVREAFERGGNRAVQVLELRDLNHQFQTVRPGQGRNPGDTEETMAPAVLELVSAWVGEHGRMK